MFSIDFFRNKNIFITGHTGFKGAWLCKILTKAGANVTGYALAPPTNPSLFEIANIKENITSVIGDIRDTRLLEKTFSKANPEFVFHLAAQPIVRESYIDPASTFETNVMGTVNILECVRSSDSVRSFLNVTTDKVYKNYEWEWGYRENDILDGFDPYSNSKSCSELVTSSYKRSFFRERSVAISTARAGNVIGGGDFANDRIIPDCVKAVVEGRDIILRNPHSIRPYQHVLDPLFAYLIIAAFQADDQKYAGNYNVGPDDEDCISTGDLVNLFVNAWGNGLGWGIDSEPGPHEASFLKLDCSRFKSKFGWSPAWNIENAIKKTVEWVKAWQSGSSILDLMDRQIVSFYNSMGEAE